ncbi:MAG: hypothetical protein Greene041662_710 [Candidatus Peregrinibacteria bacterium Greene0416_62]|nr:MAG: hypothetical protein Greene041662_710 [Candidatus Peregrinibacteria bacterium Greene0416_62]TSC97620.1 MAG: hypothetical protein Greene101449_1148 [Candidatus Peregrinibacteria bacterium Greene1014_49]
MSPVASPHEHLSDPWYRLDPHIFIDGSDTHGGYHPDSTKRDCLETAMTTAIRGGMKRTVSVGTWGREGTFPYLAAEADRLCHRDEISGKDTGKVALQFNGAPRDGTTENGTCFHALHTGRLLVIGHPQSFTHLRSAAQDSRARCYNVITTPKNQFRSSQTPRAAFTPEMLEHVENDAFISQIPEPANRLQIGAFDSFGNAKLLAQDPSQSLQEIRERSVDRKGTRYVEMQVGSSAVCTVALALDGQDLKDIGGKGASLAIIQDHFRGGLLTIVWPWEKNATIDQKIEHSPYYAFSNNPFGRTGPITSSSFAMEGAPVSIREAR